MFCPQCKCEYLEGITECADCGTPLVERLPQEETASKEFDPMEDLVTIKKFSTRHEAEVAKGFLLANGINAVISNDDWMGFRGGGIHLRRDKIRLLIKKEDVPEAEKIFREAGIPTQKESLKILVKKLNPHTEESEETLFDALEYASDHGNLTFHVEGNEIQWQWADTL